MFHNTGPYGPNEAPVNMGAPINVSQLSSPMNVSQNLNNLGKTPQNTPQGAAEHFSLPNYPSYVSAPPNLGSQMHSFPNYHALHLQQSYMPQNSPIMPNLGWQNGMLPMNLNMHNEQPQNMPNYQQIDKKTIENVSITDDQILSAKMPLNVPQVPNNFFQRHFESESNSQSMFNDQFKPFDGHSNDLSSKPQEIMKDSSRRKNLENTVRLIEDILINTTKNREKELENESKECNAKNIETETNNMDTSMNSCPDIVPTEPKIEKTIEPSKDSPKFNDDSNSKPESDCSDETLQTEDNIKTVNDKKPDQHIDFTIKLEPEEVSEVEVKIEPISSWTDTEHTAPFHRDVNGVLQEEIGFANIIDSESSVTEATRIMENSEDCDSYFECPYCSMLFKHPKRFLIHTKWHLFGLINEQRLEIAKERENRKLQRKGSRQEGPMGRRPWPCKDCDKVFNARGGLESHRKRCHTNSVRECKMCGKTINGWGPWRAHLAAHDTGSGYQCPHCPKKFKYPNSLAKHKDTHLEKTHECAECPKKFGSQTLLKVHMKSHERAKNGASLHCSFCGKAFFDRFNMQIHERTHTNERPFVCEICNASFRCNSNLQRHIKVSHNSSKPFECPTCHRSFANEGIRDRHQLRAHGDPEDFKYVCKQCPSRYMKLNELKKHTYKIHPKPKSKQSGEEDK
ncbi:hypothetical protein ABMA28_011591 [Loxostege sticticalis]|uniref:C2H2-type domain-containing protein n=1 Tax=Loxostege sticticalis TaxID=481309 RepID=A0ABD0S6U8_LOXSC